MPDYIGANQIASHYVGGQGVTKVYLGSTLIYVNS